MMPSLAEGSPTLLVQDLMFEALRHKNERLNGLALELFARIGKRTVHSLVLIAANPKNPPGIDCAPSRPSPESGP